MNRLVAQFARCIILTGLMFSATTRLAFASSDGSALTVVELFTSQGCNSCPPADRYLSELATRPGILALSWFVNYWNYLGWTDTFGRNQNTERQRQYNRHLALLGVYTPQVVINGVTQEVGSRRAEIEAKLAAQRAGQLMRIAVALDDDNGQIAVRLGTGKTTSPAVVWLIGFRSTATVAIRGGELRGRTMNYRNVVVSSHKLGSWDGSPQNYMVSPKEIESAGGDSAAVLVQYDGTGPIIGAAELMLSGHSQP